METRHENIEITSITSRARLLTADIWLHAARNREMAMRNRDAVGELFASSCEKQCCLYKSRGRHSCC